MRCFGGYFSLCCVFLVSDASIQRSASPTNSSYLPTYQDHHAATPQGKVWDAQSKDARVMLSAWRSCHRDQFKNSLLPRFLKWAQRTIPAVKQTVAAPLQVHLRGNSGTDNADDSKDAERGGNLRSASDVTPARRCWDACTSLVQHSRVAVRDRTIADKIRSVMGSPAEAVGSGTSVGSTKATSEAPVNSLAVFMHWALLDLVQQSNKHMRTNDICDISLVVSDNEEALERVYAFYLSGQSDLTMRGFGALMRDCSIIAAKARVPILNQKKKKREHGSVRRARVVGNSEDAIAAKGVMLKQAQIDIAFVRVTKSQSAFITALNEKIKVMKMEAIKKKQEKKKSKGAKTKNKVNAEAGPSGSAEITSAGSMSLAGVPSSATASAFLTRAGFVQALCILAIQRYSSPADVNANANATVRPSRRRSAFKGASRKDSQGAKETPTKVTNMLPAECLRLLLEQDILPQAGSIDQQRMYDGLVSPRVSRVLETNEQLLCAEFGRWAGATGNLGPQHDSERKISLREWTAFLGSWHLLKVGGSGDVKASSRVLSRVSSRATSRAQSRAVSRTPSAVGLQTQPEEVGWAMSDVTEALNELGEQEGTDPGFDQRLVATAHERNRHSHIVVRQSARVLAKRPVRQLTIWEAKHAFTVAMSRPHPPEMADNALFQKFCSWDDSKKKRIAGDRHTSDAGLTSKAWVEALCTVAKFQQPCPYLSLDEALEYFLENILGGKSHEVEAQNRI